MIVDRDQLDYAMNETEAREAMASPESIELLRSNSDSRRSASEDFKNFERKIARYVELKDESRVSLNEEKFLARREANAESEDEKSMAVQRSSTSKIERDFYLDEVLQIASDYAQLYST